MLYKKKWVRVIFKIELNIFEEERNGMEEEISFKVCQKTAL